MPCYVGYLEIQTSESLELPRDHIRGSNSVLTHSFILLSIISADPDRTVGTQKHQAKGPRKGNRLGNRWQQWKKP